jgi:hypothetical protein
VRYLGRLPEEIPLPVHAVLDAFAATIAWWQEHGPNLD